MDKQLIVDAGFHKGEDTSFYLEKGYRVVAIDASPELVAEGKKRFQNYIDQGKFQLLNYAISETTGEKITFYFGETTLWNSTNKNVTDRTGGFSHSAEIDSITLLDVFKQHGTPYYCKIDLEGMDATAIRSLGKGHLPTYISCESECYGYNESISPEESLDTLNALADLGYNRFKLIDQEDLSEINSKKLLYVRRNWLVSKYLKWSRILAWRILGIANTAQQKLNRKHQFDFVRGSSGPGPLDEAFREPKDWMDYQQIRELILFYREQRLAFDGKNLWLDIHATIA